MGGHRQLEELFTLGRCWWPELWEYRGSIIGHGNCADGGTQAVTRLLAWRVELEGEPGKLR